MQILARSALVALVLFGCVGCDQVSKSAARLYLPGSGVHSYLGDTVRLQFAQNSGAFLNLGDSLPPALRYDAFVVGVGAIVAALLIGAVWSGSLTWLQRIAVAAMGAGGAGIFNVADAVLVCGVILLLLGRRRPPV